MQDLRVWMTGAGVVTALGDSLETTWARLLRGERAIGPIDLFDTTGLRGRIGGQVRELTIPDPGAASTDGPRASGTSGAGQGLWSRTCALAWRAAAEAILQAKLDTKSARVGLVVGGTTGGMFENEGRLALLHVDPDAKEALTNLLSHPLTSTGDRLHETLGPFTRVRTLCTACSSGANAFIVAAHWLLSGEVDAVVAGGTDGLCRLTLAGFNALQAIDPEPSRPFDRRRRGLNLGEGAGFAVFERSTRAEARGARPIAELTGWAIGAEAHHITNPEPTGAIAGRTVARAIRRAGLSPREIDYVNAHGTGTLLNDPMESAALARALLDEVHRVPVSSSKAQFGHTLAAAGAIEGIVAALAIDRGWLPPTVGLDEPDPACPLVHVPHVGRQANVRAALSNSFGFGGMDTVLLFTEPGLGPPPQRTRRPVVFTGVGALTKAGLDGSDRAARLVDPTEQLAPPGALTVDFSQHLDIARARRLDRSARLGAVVCDHALAEASRQGGPLDRKDLGAVLGTSYASVDPAAAFIHRLVEKGARFASPAEFPNMVPSSPVGHVSIYLGSNGPVLATSDLGVSGESALMQAAELIAAGEAEAVLAGAVEEVSAIIERSFAVVFARNPGAGRTPRAEGAAAVLLEAEDAAVARGAKVLARLGAILTWRDRPDTEPSPLSTLGAPAHRASAKIVLGRRDAAVDALIASSSWKGVDIASVQDRAGEHEALGAVAIAAGVSLLATHAASEVLIVGLARDRGYAIVLARA